MITGQPLNTAALIRLLGLLFVRFGIFPFLDGNGWELVATNGDALIGSAYAIFEIFSTARAKSKVPSPKTQDSAIAVVEQADPKLAKKVKAIIKNGVPKAVFDKAA